MQRTSLPVKFPDPLVRLALSVDGAIAQLTCKKRIDRAFRCEVISITDFTFVNGNRALARLKLSLSLEVHEGLLRLHD